MTRIDGLGPLETSRTQHGAAAQGVDRANGGARELDQTGGRQDEISLSWRARNVAGAAAAVQNAPDVRTEKVAALRAAIINGTYQPDARQVAERLLASGTFDRS
jgi:negative regulator of flagellin synthesis FlgM